MCMCVYIYNIYVHFSKLGCLLYILCITSCFPSQNTTLHSAHHEPLLTATNGTETTHYGLGWQMAIKTMDANHIPKVWRQSCPAPGKARACPQLPQLTGHLRPGHSGIHTRRDSQSSSSHFLHSTHSYLSFSGPGAQGHSDSMPSVKQKSPSSHRKDNS